MAPPVLYQFRIWNSAGSAVEHTGSGHARHVVLGDDGARSCDCEDSLYRGTSRCKHILAALLSMGDREVLEALADLVEGLAA